MTEEDLDGIAASLSKDADATETVRKRIARTVSYLKSDPEALKLFFELADVLRDVGDMKRLLGTDNEMFQELAVPATKRGIDAFKSLTARVRNKNILIALSDILIALSDIAMAFANRGRKPVRRKRNGKEKRWRGRGRP